MRRYTYGIVDPVVLVIHSKGRFIIGFAVNAQNFATCINSTGTTNNPFEFGSGETFIRELIVHCSALTYLLGLGAQLMNDFPS